MRRRLVEGKASAEILNQPQALDLERTLCRDVAPKSKLRAAAIGQDRALYAALSSRWRGPESITAGSPRISVGSGPQSAREVQNLVGAAERSFAQNPRLRLGFTQPG